MSSARVSLLALRHLLLFHLSSTGLQLNQPARIGRPQHFSLEHLTLTQPSLVGIPAHSVGAVPHFGYSALTVSIFLTNLNVFRN
jgi:hypothetical protein